MEQSKSAVGKKQLTCTDCVSNVTNGLTEPNINLQKKNNNFTTLQRVVFLYPQHRKE